MVFWNKHSKHKHIKFIIDTLTQAEEKLKQKDEKWLHIAYGAFASNDPDLVRRGGCAVRSLLKDYDMSKMIRLSETFRQYTSMEWYLDWNTIRPASIKNWFSSEEDYRYAIILGSFHPNGYYRERCLCELITSKYSLPFIILRMNDWVETIRRRAVSAAFSQIQNGTVEELFYAAPAMDKIRRSGRREAADLTEAERLIKLRLEKEAGGISVETILAFDFGIRKSMYRFLFSGRILEREKAERLLAKEKHSFCQSVMISGILKHYDCPLELADGYLRHKNSSVRRKALEYKYEIVKNSWLGLDAMLLDSNRGIRDFAAFILERYENYDTPGFYLRHLNDENPVIPIIETGVRGDRESKNLLMPFLDHPREKVVRCTLTAIGRLEFKYTLADTELKKIFWKFLFDQRRSVSKSAFHASVKNGIGYGADVIYEALKHSSSDWTKGCLLNLLNHEKCWERMPYLLYLYSELPVEERHGKILSGLYGRNLYCTITKAQGQAVLQALKACEDSLPQQLVKEIRFDLRYVMKR